MRRTVRARHAGAVDHEHDGKLVQSHVHDRLIECAGEERRVDADHRMHAGHRETCCKSDRMLLADPDVEEAIRKFLGEVQQPGGRSHRGGDGANLRPPGGRRHQRLAEYVRVRHLGRAGPAGERVKRADAMQLVDLVLDRGTVAVALFRDHVHDHRLAQLLGAGQDLLERRLIVAVDESRVLDAQAFEHRRRLQQLLEALLDPVRGLVRGRTNQRQVAQQA